MADAEIALAEGQPEHALERLDELLKLTEQTGRAIRKRIPCST